jgi:cytochrome c oxidase assembly protein Cox11
MMSRTHAYRQVNCCIFFVSSAYAIVPLISLFSALSGSTNDPVLHGPNAYGSLLGLLVHK